MFRTVLFRILAAALLASALALSARAAEQPLPLWRVDGDQNTIYLLGSIHLLREADYPLDPAIYTAYADADSLIMELDMDDLDPSRMQGLVAQLGTISGGRSLADLMGEDLYAEAVTLADKIGIPLQMMASIEPWLAAITIEQVMLQRIGFDPQFGVETHFMNKAASDGKEILGLEDIEEQLGFLDGLSAEAQRSLLMQTLGEAIDIEPIMNELVDAWKQGDTAYLESSMLEDMRTYPELYKAIVVDRNRRWVTSIGNRLDDGNDYLVIVGALHLVGEESVPALLSQKGQSVLQVKAAGQ